MTNADLAATTTPGNPDDARARHAKQDALNGREYQLLLEGAHRMPDYEGQHAKLVVLTAGRLGLRAGEITHLREDWIDWRRQMLEIPRQQGCEKGRDGGLCGQCRQAARQLAEYNAGVDVDQALAVQWAAKTDAAAREVPFGWSPRTELCLERFFDRYDAWPLSQNVVNRRLNDAAAAADELAPGEIYPHALRATAGTYHAGRGLRMLQLKSLMGWASLSTAKHYIADSGENTARALDQIHSR